MTKHSKEVLEKYLNADTEGESFEGASGEETKEVETLEEIWQNKEAKAEVDARHMPKEKAYRGHKV
ncbi:MAG: hypothetical protein AB9883_10230 [Acidaminococcaceae bacterium]